MKAASFEYVRATAVEDACAMLAEQGETARLLAGGQSLLPALNLRLASAGLLIDIARIPALHGVRLEGRTLRIGAATQQAALLTDGLVREHAPLLQAALAHVAHPAIRARGTIGGNLCHADPASELPACALALDAVMVAQSVRGQRRIAAANFFTGLFATALAPDEVLLAVEVPSAAGQRHGFVELSRRRGDYAIVGAAAQRGTTLRVAFFSVSDRAVLATHAAATAGREAACAALSLDLDPPGDLQASAATRLHLARVVLGRVLDQIT